MTKRTPVIVASAALLLVLAALCVSPRDVVPRFAASNGLPTRLSDQEFWELVNTMSEPGGYFRSDNLLSNEDTFQYVIPTLTRRLPMGGVYLGVGPDQNFTYIETLQPRMAFVVDIRRQNMLELLMYKALLEMSPDRVEFLSRLFSRPAPEDLSADSSVEDLFKAYDEVAPSGSAYRRNLQAITDRLVGVHGFSLSHDDLSAIDYVYRAFYSAGPDLRYSFPRGGPGGNIGQGGGGGARGFPSYAELMMATDTDSVEHGYLANDHNFQVLRSYELNNLLVPLVGDFGGDKALKAVGRYLTEHGATLTLFYTSNVEQYLFQSDDQWRRFYDNLSTIPMDRTSTLLRSYFNMGGGFRAQQPFGGGGYPSRSGMLTDSIPDLLDAVHDGRVRSYYDVIERGQ
jgi:hypothetical protein